MGGLIIGQVGTGRLGRLSATRVVRGRGRFGSRLFGLQFRLTANRLRGATHLGRMHGSVTHVGAMLQRRRLRG